MSHRRRPLRRISAILAFGLLATMMLAGADGTRAQTSPVRTPPVQVTIDQPATGEVLRPGEIAIRGRVTGAGAGDTATVLYVADVSGSSAWRVRGACGGDATRRFRADLNGDGYGGDLLDCEIATLTRLNDRLDAAASADAGAGTAPGNASGDAGRVRVGLVAFSSRAAAADLSPAIGQQPFAAPGQAHGGSGGTPAVLVAARSLRQGWIGRYTRYRLGVGTDLDDALATSLRTLRAAPPGPKWVVFLSDGEARVSGSSLARLRAAAVNDQVRLRALPIGGDVGCGPRSTLVTMARATGDRCVPADAEGGASALATDVVAGLPGEVRAVTVAAGGRTVAATVAPDGDWQATLTLGPGEHTLLATAALSDGSSFTTELRSVVQPVPLPARASTPVTTAAALAAASPTSHPPIASPPIVTPPIATAPAPTLAPVPVPLPTLAVPEPSPPAPAHMLGGSRPALLRLFPTPGELQLTLALVAQSFGWAFLLLILAGLPAELFNATLGEHEGRIKRRLGGWFPWFARRSPRERRQRGRLPQALGLVLIAGFAAALMIMVDPTLPGPARWRAEWPTVLTSLIGLLTAFIVTTLVYSGSSEAWIQRSYPGRAALETIPMALVLAGLFALLSFAGNFVPGYVYGLVAGFAARDRDPDSSTRGQSVLVGAMVILAVAALAWFSWGWVREPAGQPDAPFGLRLADVALGAIFVTGVEAVIFGLIPLRCFDGSKLTAWSKLRWAAVYMVGAFWFILLLNGPKSSEQQALVDDGLLPPLASLLIPFAVFATFSVLFWGYFRLPEGFLRRGQRASG
jgi:hypothetical protein